MTITKQEYSLVEPELATERHVNMSNRLARAAQGLNLSEKRLVALGLAGTDSIPLKGLALAANAGWKMKISAQEYAEAFDISSTAAYEQLKDAASNLFERYVRYQTKGRRGAIVETTFRWVSSAKYADGDGYVELNFSPEIAPHLLGLRKQFTSYKLKHAAAFESVYAWRLFEVLKSWKSHGFFSTSIEDFWDLMEAPPSCRKDFKALRVRVIEPSVQAITTKSAMVVEWKPIRSGSRRVTGLEFRFKPDPQGRLDINNEDDINDGMTETGEFHSDNNF